MLTFFLKKAFFDGWDHLFTLVLLNLGFLALIGLGLLLPAAAPNALVLYVCLFPLVLLGAIWYATSVFAMVKVADYGSVAFRDLPGLLRSALLPGLQYALMGLGVGAAVVVGLPFYLSRGGYLGAIAAGLLLWGSVFFLLALQWYLPLRARLGGSWAKNLRKSFVVFFDNSLFSLFIFAYSGLGLILSVLLAFLVPGLAGTALGLDGALKLRLLKYDWLEAHPGAKRSAVPWEELLAEDQELVGTRTLKNTIFPWKY